MREVKLLESDLPIIEIKKEVNKVFSEINDHNALQIGLQSNSPSDNNWKSSIGSVEKNSQAARKNEETYIYPIFDLPVINEYMEKYNMFRTRIMVSLPRTTLTWHRDYTPRIHIPITSNPNAFILVKDRLEHLKVGNCYWVNTMCQHTAINCDSKDARIHIVGCVQSDWNYV